MKKPARVVAFLLLGALALVTLLVCAELVLRYRLRDNIEVRYYRHARLRRALVRDVSYDDRIHVNRHGTRGPDFPVEKPLGTTRVLVVGASTTFDTCARRDAETWPARLEHWLHELAPGRAFHVINAGVPGSEMIDHAIRLQTELHAFDPDVVVAYAGHGIVASWHLSPGEGDDPRTPGAVPVEAPWERWLRNNSRLYLRLRPVPFRPEQYSLAGDEWARALDNSVAQFERDLRSFGAVARAMGAEVVFTEINRLTGTRPFEELTEEERTKWDRAFPPPPDVVLEGYRRYREIWEQTAGEIGGHFIPVEALAITGPEHYCGEAPIQFSRKGADEMGRRLAEQLIGRGVL